MYSALNSPKNWIPNDIRTYRLIYHRDFGITVPLEHLQADNIDK